MITIFKEIYGRLRSVYHKLKFYYTINWTKTIYFNFKKFPFCIAKKLPVFFYGKVKFHNIKGEIIIDAPIKSGMIGFGQTFELFKKEQGIAEFNLSGKVLFKGYAHFGKDCLVYIGPNSYCEIGNMFALGSRGKLISYEKIIFGKYVRIGYESQLIDTNFHAILDLKTNEVASVTSPIQIGDYNWIGNRSTIMQKTITSNFCIIASNSLTNKDYTFLGKNILIGGIPAKLLKNNISRDWEGERELFKIWMNI